MAGIYIHIPFCKQACHYCDFHFSTSRNVFGSLVNCIKEELKLRRDSLVNIPVTTVYFGGGTPSLLSASEIDSILNTIGSHYDLEQSAEITLEANPDDLTREYLHQLVRTGVNRLSIGIQSFQPPVLSWMNRVHSTEQASTCLKTAQGVGFENISVDLIYGIPIPEYDIETDLMKVLEFQPQHISAYNLTIESATVLGTRLRKGLLEEIPEEVAADSFLMVMDRLKSKGYLHYEISNFALPGKESRHNLGYWNGKPYLGIGPSAHSFDGENRQYNLANNSGYIKSIQNGYPSFEREELTAEQRINEMIMLGLRTSEGVQLYLQHGEFSWDLEKQNPKQLEYLVSNHFALIRENRLILTDRGKLIADRIAADLFIETS